MTSGSVQFKLFPGDGSRQANGAPSRDIQQLWFSLARLGWSSLVLVPADEGCSTGAVASSLADVGSRLRDSPVTVILADSMDYQSARILADLELRVRDDREHAARGELPPAPAAVPISPVPPGTPPPLGGAEAGGAAHHGDGKPHEARLLPPVGQVVVAIQPVVVEPLGVAIAHAADAVVICVRLGESRLAAARRTIELIGADRISGALLVS